jgi:large subunit ribosomal protein L24
MRIKKDDKVIILTGRDKGKSGQVIEILPKKDKVRVKDAAMVTKHQKPNKQNGKKGSIIKIESWLNASNVMLFFKGKPTRIGYKLTEDGKKVRIARSTGEVID